MDIEVKKSQIHGKGVFAKRNFKKGETIFKWNPKKLTKGESKKTPRNLQKYMIKIKGQYYLMQPPERYVNHSCTPNAVAESKKFIDMAKKNIKKGEEITVQYHPFEHKVKCTCGSKKCKGII